MNRRELISGLGSAAAWPLAVRAQQAAMPVRYPTRPVRFVVGFPPGGVSDITARLIGQWLSERMGQNFLIDNRSGASGNIAVEAVVRAPADGYTLLLAGSQDFTNATAFERLNFNFIRDIAPVAGILRAPLVMEVNPSVPVRTVPEFIAYAKANPGKVNMGSAGVGGPNHVAGELFKMMTGINMLHVPYRGSGPLITDLLGGQMHVAFDTMPSSLEHIRSGKLRALAVTTVARSEALPEIPTVSSFVPGYEASYLNGVGVPRNTSNEIIERLNGEINAALADPNVRARLSDLGGTPLLLSPDDFGKLIADETSPPRCPAPR